MPTSFTAADCHCHRRRERFHVISLSAVVSANLENCVNIINNQKIRNIACDQCVWQLSHCTVIVWTVCDVNTERTWRKKITGSGCTKRPRQLKQLRAGTTVTRRPIETGQEVNPMSGLHASVTPRTGSRTGFAPPTGFTTLARNAQVVYWYKRSFLWRCILTKQESRSYGHLATDSICGLSLRFVYKSTCLWTYRQAADCVIPR